MKDTDVVELLKEQNKLISSHNDLFRESLGDFKRILNLQAAEAKLVNARTALIDETLQKMLSGVASLGDNFEKLLANLES